MAPIDLISCLVSAELQRRGDRLLERRRKNAEFRDPQKTLDIFDFNFNKKMNRSLVFDLATANFIAKHEDALFLGPPGTGKSHLAQAIGQAAIQQGYRVLYREAHTLIEDLADAAFDQTRKEQMELFSTVPLLIIDDRFWCKQWNRSRGAIMANGHILAIGAFQRTTFRSGNYPALRTVVPEFQTEVSRFGPDDDRARNYPGTHNDSALGPTVCSGV
jgi:hypothetical protein